MGRTSQQTGMWAVAVSTLLLSAPAHADLQSSMGVGSYVEPLRWTGPGELDPAEMTLSDTAYGAVIPLRLTWTQDPTQPRALGITTGLTIGLGGSTLGESTASGHFMLEVLGRVAVYGSPTWSLQLGVGGALEHPVRISTNGVLSNDNVEPYGTLAGGVAAASVTLFGDNQDYTFDLRSGVLVHDNLIAIPVVLTASLVWGRSRPAAR